MHIHENNFIYKRAYGTLVFEICLLFNKIACGCKNLQNKFAY